MKKAFIILMILPALFLCACGNTPSAPVDDRAPIYEEALSLLEGGDYLAAADKFAECSDYLDSETMRLEAQYQYALNLFSNDDRKAAKKAFSSIKDYKDSASMIMECDYVEAVAALDEGNISFATSKFKSLKDYKDSKELLLECQYQSAQTSLKKHEYSDALKVFEALGQFKDSQEMVMEVKYQEGQSLLRDKKIEEAFQIFSSIPEYKTVPDILQQFQEVKRLSWLKASWTDNLGNTSRYSEDYKYDSGGNLIRREANNSFLNETSSLIHAWMAQPNYPYATIEVYEYTKGKLSKITGKNGSANNYVVTYSYNDQGVAITEDVVTTTDSGQLSLSYDDAGNLVRVESDTNHGVNITISYDSHNNISSVYNTVGFGYRYNYSYSYDEESDRILEVRVTTNFGGDYKDEYFYDSSGLVSRIKRVYDNGSQDVTIDYGYKTILIYDDTI